MAQTLVDGFTEVAFASGVFDQDDFTRTDDAGFAIAGGDLHTVVEIDDILPAWGVVPVQVIGGLNSRKIIPVVGKRLVNRPAGVVSTYSISISSKCESPFSSV